MPSLLIVDDDKEGLEALVHALGRVFRPNEATILKWSPSKADSDALAAFQKNLSNDTLLVIADQDLTSKGLTGLFGSTIVDWCQERAIPVGNFSRLDKTALPKGPDLFQIRVPAKPEEAAPIITSLFRGFRRIGELIEASDQYLAMRSPSAVLANILGNPEIESQLSLYTVRLGATSGALMSKITNESPSPAEKKALLTYIVGHLLLTVLRFPGPIISNAALKAYLASEEADSPEVTKLFENARYAGPFEDMDSFYWLSKVDLVIEDLVPDGVETLTAGELNRLAVETRLKRKLRRHGCPICKGVNGGFYCPFPHTRTTVCVLPECSVSSNSWIPQGASLCRIEREFFDEWAPILGL